MGAGDNYTPWKLMFNLQDLSGVTDFTALFDEVRVNKLTYKFMPRFNSSNVNEGYLSTDAAGTTTSALAIPDFLYAVDDDGLFGNGTLAGMMQYGNCRVRRGSDVITVSFVPTAFTGLQTNPAGTTSNVGKFKKKWMSLSSGTTGVDFYGLAIGLQLPKDLAAPNRAAASGATFNSYAYWWDVYVTADLSFRKTV